MGRILRRSSFEVFLALGVLSPSFWPRERTAIGEASFEIRRFVVNVDLLPIEIFSRIVKPFMFFVFGAIGFVSPRS